MTKHGFFARFALSTSFAAALAAPLSGCSDHPPSVVCTTPPDVAKLGQMTMTGQATLEVSPDCADLTMTLTTDVAKVADAAIGVQAKQRALIDALAKLGVTGNDVKLSQLDLSPVYEQTLTGVLEPKIRSYRASIAITATTRDFAKISALMQAGAEAGATQVSSQFRNDDLPSLKKRVRDMALAAVQDKARQTAGALDSRVGRILNVAESTGGQMWSQSYFPQAANTMASSNSGGALGGTLQPLTLDVTVTYEILPRA